ncbi:MAG: hypothetical protein IPJ41_03885 [Phycisphaerales bacterium]|nr:hypothetical protein [Phycisphaerales bacterium]
MTSPAGRTFVLLSLLALGARGAGAQEDLLPDITVRQSDLYDHDISVLGNGRWIRLSNGTPNIGDGKLYLYGVLPQNDDGTQTVRQRVYRDDGTYWDTDVGYFIYHPEHDHIHFEDWAIYRLRQVLEDGGVGPILAEGEKTSFCILDLQVFDSSLPNFNPYGQFHSCSGTVQGLSVGWLDIYSKGLAGQRINITGVPDGQYWLESEVDPLRRIVERDTTNNIARILITLGEGGSDVAEPNNSMAQVAMRPEGGPNSPNLGPCGPRRVIPDLSIDTHLDEDYFRFYVNDTGGPDDFVRIDFDKTQGDLDLELWTDAGELLRVSHGAGDFEQIPLTGQPEGWYFARIYGFADATSPRYSLTIDPPENEPPAIEITAPPPGDTVLEHGVDTYRVEWTASYPENDRTWVTLYLNHHPEIDEHAFLLPTSVNTPGEDGFYIVNSAYVPPDTYWVIAQVTDGGAVSEGVSLGTITFVEICPGDFTRDGLRDTRDVLAFLNAWTADDPRADQNHDGAIDSRDVTEFLNAWTGPC